MGNNLEQYFEAFASKIGALDRQSSDVAAWSRKTGDEAGAYRVVRHREHDRDDRCRPLCNDGSCGWRRNNDIDLEPDELGCNLGKALVAAVCPAILNRDGAILDPTKLA